MSLFIDHLSFFLSYGREVILEHFILFSENLLISWQQSIKALTNEWNDLMTASMSAYGSYTLPVSYVAKAINKLVAQNW